MATGPSYAGPTNGYIPNWEASGRLAEYYSRNPKDFPIMNYLQLRESKKMKGFWMRFSSQESRRYLSNNAHLWAPAARRPERVGGDLFTNISFEVKRYEHGFTLDDDTENQADWDIAEQMAATYANQAMVGRTYRGVTVLTTAASWQTSAANNLDMSTHHTDTATNAGGGKFDVGTSTAPYFFKGLNYAAELIAKETSGVVKSSMLQVIMNPVDARRISTSAEFHDYLKGSPDAREQIRENKDGNGRYGMPDTVYGYKVVIEDTTRQTSAKGATSIVSDYVWPTASIAMVARKGVLDAGVIGAASFSTLNAIWYRDEMTLERFEDKRNRRFEYSVVTSDDFILMPLSGYLFTATSG